MKVVIVDYGVGNVGSLMNMLRRVTDAEIVCSDSKQVIENLGKGDKLFLPGVGNFGFAMRRLVDLDLVELLRSVGQAGAVDMMGICLGAQLILESSEEANEAGLGIIKGACRKFKMEDMPSGLRIPHMGWSEVEMKDGSFVEGLEERARFYFVHSYHMVPEEVSAVLCVAEHGHPFYAGIIQNRSVGVQFHPEKSHRFGMELLRSFINWGHR